MIDYVANYDNWNTVIAIVIMVAFVAGWMVIKGSDKRNNSGGGNGGNGGGGTKPTIPHDQQER